ncbi:hypothetical protein ColTof3_10846 [Colletotrichum tofieldiae]|nr:hypothetical protein ColTof3_10846 [Colletotrichum tofieldiae]
MTSAAQSIHPQGLAVLSGLHALTSSKSNSSCQPEQPPAYTPPARPRIFENFASRFTGQDAVPDSGGVGTIEPLDSILEAITDDGVEESSPISLRISTRIKVASDGNLIALPCAPTDQANSIAKAIIEAIQGRDWVAGFPMIDENGRPRPLKLEIDAGMTVEGSSNVIGTESAISQFLRRGTQAQNRSPDRQPGNETSDSATSPVSPKRRRQESKVDTVEETVRKRARSE